MKKFLSLTLGALLSLTLLCAIGCNQPKGVVNVQYYGTAQDIVPQMLAGKESIALIPEPAATNLEKALDKQGKSAYRLDLQELYDSENKAYPQAVLMVKKNVLTSDLYNALKMGINESVEFAKASPSDAVLAIKGNYENTSLNVNTLTASAIEGCKIYFESADLAKDSVKKYIEDIRSIEQSSAVAVTDEFFFNKTQPSVTPATESLTFACPDGAPALAISKLIKDSNQLGTGKSVNYKVINASEIGPQMATGKADILLMPVNAASKLYNKHDANNPYVCAGVVTHGNFYIMSTEKITINDLTDKKIALPNMGAVPDWTIRKVLINFGYEINVLG